MQNKTTKSQTKPSIDWEAVRVLAIELGAREAARRLGLNESTVLSRARRDKWKLRKRKGGATLKNASAITLRSKPGDVLIATHKELETTTKTALMQTAAKAAQQAIQNSPLDVSNIGELRDLVAAAAKVFGWDVVPRVPAVQVYGDKVAVVCDEATRAKLIEQRERLLSAKAVSQSATDAPKPSSDTQQEPCKTRFR
jgi:hypothetical protein